MKFLCLTFDAYYDEKHNWLEKKCNDEDCPYCPNRPEKACEKCVDRECENNEILHQ